MTNRRWVSRLFGILGVALTAAGGASVIPDNPYQRWQLIEHTIFDNATWAYERIHFDPAPIGIAIIGASRTQLGLSAPEIEKRLAELGTPCKVANLSVLADGRNIEWAIVDELFKAKRPKVLVVMVEESVYPWGYPGFKYVAPAVAFADPEAVLLHNTKDDLLYLPYRQIKLFGASLAPKLFGLRDEFDRVHYASKISDYTFSHTQPDGKRIDMEKDTPAVELRAQRLAFLTARAASDSNLPASIRKFSDRDDRKYLKAISQLAFEHDTQILFVFLPTFGGKREIEDNRFYSSLGMITDNGDLSLAPNLYLDFTHLNRRGALIASHRLALVIAKDFLGRPVARLRARLRMG